MARISAGVFLKYPANSTSLYPLAAARDHALDVLLHCLTHGVELQADALDMRAPQPRQAGQPGRHGRAPQQLEKTAAIAHGARLLGVGDGTRTTRAGPAARGARRVRAVDRAG